MDIILSNSSGKPIYEQITDQVKAQILSGALAAAYSFIVAVFVLQDDIVDARCEVRDGKPAVVIPVPHFPPVEVFHGHLRG